MLVTHDRKRIINSDIHRYRSVRPASTFAPYDRIEWYCALTFLTLRASNLPPRSTIPNTGVSGLDASAPDCRRSLADMLVLFSPPK